MSVDVPIREGQVLPGSLFGEPMRMETIRSNGPEVWIAGLAGQRWDPLRRITLVTDGISNLTIQEMLCGSQGVISRSEAFA